MSRILLATEEHRGRQVWVVESVPHEEAAVVWGKEVLRIRDDWVLLEQQFWSQDGELVKALTALEIEEMAGRPVATVMRMSKTEAPGEYTELRTHEVEFDLHLADSLFTLSSLRNPRQ